MAELAVGDRQSATALVLHYLTELLVVVEKAFCGEHMSLARVLQTRETRRVGFWYGVDGFRFSVDNSVRFQYGPENMSIGMQKRHNSPLVITE